MNLPRLLARYVLRRMAGAARAALRQLVRAEGALATPAVVAREQRMAVRRASLAHDMVESDDEAYYRDRYLVWIDEHLAGRRDVLAGTLLDAGCGSGRLTVPLAERAAAHGGRVLGVDMLDESVEQTRAYAYAAGRDNVELEVADLLTFLRSRPDDDFSGAIFLEVGFVIRELDEILRELARVLAPGAPLLASLRPRLFLAQLGVALGDWDLAEAAATGPSPVRVGAGFQQVHSAHELRELFGGAGWRIDSMASLGPCSGIEGDPLGRLLVPKDLSADEFHRLARIEGAFSRSHPDVGRYVLVTAGHAE